jgi:enoyl-CoA hydratase
MSKTLEESRVEINRRDFLTTNAEVLAIAGAGLAIAQVALAQPAQAQPPQRTITVDRREGGIMLIGIDRQERQNRVDPDTVISLGKAMYQLENDNDARVGVLFGHGRNFCPSIDPESFPDAIKSGKLPPKDPDYINPLNYSIGRQRTKPLVVAVQGMTQLVGHELFLAADVRVAATDTVFSQGEAARGVFPAGGGTVRFVREAGWGNAMRYMLTGETWGAEEARRMGLLQEITPPGKQLESSRRDCAKDRGFGAAGRKGRALVGESSSERRREGHLRSTGTAVCKALSDRGVAGIPAIGRRAQRPLSIFRAAECDD